MKLVTRIFWAAVAFMVLIALFLIISTLNHTTPTQEDYQVRAARTEATVNQLKAEAAAGQFWAIFWPIVGAVLIGLFVWAVVSELRHRRRMNEVVTIARANTLSPTPQGNYEARITANGVISLSPGNVVQPVPASLHYSPATHTIYKGEKESRVPEQLPPPPEETEQPYELPTAPTWATIAAGGFIPTQTRMLLGYTNQGPLYGGIDSLLSTAIAGRPRQGKSTLLRLIYLQIRLLGGDVYVLDPHASIVGEIVPDENTLIASTGEELDTLAAAIIATLVERLKAYKGGQRDFIPALVLADEFPVIALNSKPANEALRRVVLEARKVNMYALISGQGLPASQFGGSLVRDALSSRFIFKTTALQGRMAGLDATAVKMLEMLDVGRAVFADNATDPVIVAVPRCETSDLVAISKGESRPGGITMPSDATTVLENDLTVSIETLENRAAAAWENGNRSVRKLATALGISDWQARKLIADLGLCE